MSGLFARIRRFSRTPQGQRAMDTARRAAADPRRRSQARRLLSRLRGRH
ncbi:hypothetical protein [Streptomyces sp. NPDC018031]